MRVGLMQRNARRLRNQDMLDEDVMYDLELDMWECLLVGTKWQLVVQALQKLPNMTAGIDEEWSVARQFLRQRLAQRQRDRAEGSGGGEHERGKQTYTARG